MINNLFELNKKPLNFILCFVLAVFIVFFIPFVCFANDLEDDYINYDWENGFSSLNNGVSHKSDVLFDISSNISPTYYDYNHYNDLIYGYRNLSAVSNSDNSAKFYQFYEPSITFYNQSYVRYSYDSSSGNYTNQYLPINDADYYFVNNSNYYMVKMENIEDPFFMLDGILFSPSKFYMVQLRNNGGSLYASNLNSSVSYDSRGFYYCYISSQFDTSNGNFALLFTNRSGVTYSNTRTTYYNLSLNDFEGLNNRLFNPNSSDYSVLQYNVDDYPLFPEISPSEGDNNNLYVKSSDFRFRINDYVYKDKDILNKDAWFLHPNVLGSGYVDYYCNLTDYQKEHPENFNFNFEFHVSQQSTISRNALITEASYYNFNVFTNRYTIDVPLSDFVSDGIYIFKLSDIFSGLNINNITAPSFTGVNDFEDKSYNTLIGQEREWSGNSNIFYAFQFANRDSWLLYCKVNISDASQTSKGSYSENYSFVYKSSVNTDDSLHTNFDPFVPGDSNDNPVDSPIYSPDQVIDSNGNIILTNYDNDSYNNPVNVTVNSGSDPSKLDPIIDKLLPETDGGFNSKFQELAQNNRWLNVMKEYFFFMPDQVVDLFNVYFTTALGILTVAIIIFILLHLL